MAALETAAAPPQESQADADIRKFLAAQPNERGIPTVLFIDDVQKFLAQNNTSAEVVVGAFTELLQKYKVLEQSLTRQKHSLKTKIPEIENTLDLIRMLKQKQESGEEMKTHYPLADVIHTRATVKCDGTVCLWLGANVMIEYTYDEAIDMLEKNFEKSQAKLVETNEDIDHLKNQSITVEVNLARVFNYDVKIRRSQKEAQTEGK